jgi:hypothetical protein
MQEIENRILFVSKKINEKLENNSLIIKHVSLLNCKNIQSINNCLLLCFFHAGIPTTYIREMIYDSANDIMIVKTVSTETLALLKNNFCKYIKTHLKDVCTLKITETEPLQDSLSNKNVFEKVTILEQKLEMLTKRIYRKKNYIVISKFNLLNLSSFINNTDMFFEQPTWKNIVYKLFFLNEIPLLWILNCIQYTIKQSNTTVVFVYLISSNVQTQVKNKLQKYLQTNYNQDITVS